jgi:adenylate cyclase
MTLAAPTINDEGSARGAATSTLANSIRGIGVRQVRLACGLIMFSYLLSHYINHALGNISLATMQAALQYHLAWWRNPIVTFVFYTAATTHLALGLWALYQRRHFRYLAIEITQLVLGLSIPLLLITHFAGVRLSSTLFDRIPYYEVSLNGYWVLRPNMVWVQIILLLVAWTHACIGIYFWLRLKPFFKWAAPFLLTGAVLLPPLAILGLHQGAREVIQLRTNPQWRAENLKAMPSDQRRVIDDIIFYFPFGYIALVSLVFAARGVRSLNERRGGMITLSYPDRQVRVPKGLSVLEASLRFHVPHASVCGGRARCSTCRIRVISDRSVLPKPSGRESHVLQRVGASADPAIRLACQLRPTSDIAFIPILPPFIGADFVRRRVRANLGEERYIVSLFVDMRGSTKFAEERLPFDAIFLVNRFLEAASKAVVDAGGQPNQFIGDGLLALFGLSVDPATACRQAIKAAAMIAANVEHLNYQFAIDLREPIQFGIGIHGGDVIIGDIGYRERTVFTALGDAVNVAARLQDMTKSLNCKVIVSEEVFKTAGIDPGALTLANVTIRGRDEPMAIRTGPDPTILSNLLSTIPAASPSSA